MNFFSSDLNSFPRTTRTDGFKDAPPTLCYTMKPSFKSSNACRFEFHIQRYILYKLQVKNTRTCDKEHDLRLFLPIIHTK